MKVILGSRMLGVGALVLGAIVSSRAQATVTLAPASGSIYPTQSVAVSATVFSAPGLAQGVHVLTVTGLPSGVTTNPAVLSYTLTLPISVTTAVVNFQIVAGPSAAAASANVVVTDASYGSGNFALTILEPRLHLAITTPAITLGASTVNVPVGVSADPGFGVNVGAGGVPLQFGVDAGGPPANVTAGGAKNELPPYVTTLTFPFRRTGPVTSGTYVVPLTATWLGTKSSALTATASLTLTIPDIAVPDFTVTAVPPSLTLTPGSSGKITFTVTPSGGFSAPVTLTVPSNASVSAAPSTYTFPAAGGSVDVTFTASPNASAATIPVTVSAAGGAGTPVSHTVSVTVVVQPPPADFNVRVSPPAPSVPAGRATPLSFVLDAVGSFAGSATITAVQLPPGATLSPASLVLMPAIPQSASLAVPRATPRAPTRSSSARTRSRRPSRGDPS